MIDTIIFDGEGVVVDTEEIWDKGQEEFLRRRGFLYDRERIKPLLTGRSLVEGVEILQREYGFGGDPLGQARERAEIVRHLFATEVDFMEGFLVFLTRSAMTTRPVSLRPWTRICSACSTAGWP